MIPFNRPQLTGREQLFVQEVFNSGRLAGNGEFTMRCQSFFERRYGASRALLTTSCTSSLELASLACSLNPGDEVILASYGFVSTATAFAIRGATLVFADSGPDHPNVTVKSIAGLVTPRTRAIVVTHYAGVAVDMDPLMELARPLGIRVVEDAAQGIEATYKGRPLGTLGDLGTLSFHETKNIQCGEGGLLLVNDPAITDRMEIMWEKGTNRAAFFRGEVDKYTWVDLGGSFQPNETTAALLWAQLEAIEDIQGNRIAIWNRYHEALGTLEDRGDVQVPRVPPDCRHNGHIYYVVFPDLATRTRATNYLNSRGIAASFHYQSLHRSPYFAPRHAGGPLPWADHYSDCLLRLPLWSNLPLPDQVRVIDAMLTFFRGRS